MATISAIVPFFQRRAGLLSDAIKSVSCQNIECPIDILIVDDGSPVDPAVDIPTDLPANIQVRIFRQQNAGPGAARNRGLDEVSPETEYVAFIDSDDAWEPNHLRNAVAALGENLDFYFSNHLEPDSTADEFSRRQRLLPSRHQKLPRGSNCYQFLGDAQDQVIRANVIETSTVVFRWSVLRGVRFAPGFRNAFEDHLFWLDATKASRGIAFSTDVECKYGRGVSLWRSSTFGSERSMAQMVDHLRYIRALRTNYVTTELQARSLRERIDRIRRTFIAELLHRARRGMAIDWRAARQIIRDDPMLIALGLPLTLNIFWRRLRAG
jgi:succinoglycan biosynthesis protein ExoW